MAYDKSFLSSSKYGYDFVVATTQASINSGLKEYLNTIDQPVTYLCFLVNDKGNPSTYITLDELKAKTGGVNPFEIPNGTDYSDPKIAKLTQQRFSVGLKLKLGLPAGVMPKDLPGIVDLGSSASNVNFNLFLSEFEIVQNNPPSGWGSQGSWTVLSQPQGTAWYFSTKVNLVYADLNKELNTPYFDKYPAKKKELLNKLQNLDSGAFSLQQLLFDLDSAAIQSIPQVQGVPKGSNADLVLTKYFVDFYFDSVKKHGEPVLSVHAVANTPDGSSLRLTGMEREVSPFVNSDGTVVASPTPAQKDVYTLDYLCAANNNHLPGAATFDWNWVEPADVGDQSGIISINRNTLATFYKNVLLPVVRSSCIKVSCNVSAHWYGDVKYSWTLSPGQTPQKANITSSGSNVLNISYESDARGYDKSGATAGELKLHTPYTCAVSFSGNKITIVQHLTVWCYARWDNTDSDGNIFDKTITDTYTLSIGQNGSLQMSRTSSSKDDSQNPHRSGFINFFTGINDLTSDIKKKVSNFVGTTIDDIPAADIQNFVFPGAQVFTYKNVKFSDNQDLVSRITYVKPR